MCTILPRCHQMGFVSSIIEFRPILNRIPEYHHFQEQLLIGLHNSRQNREPQWPGSIRRSSKLSVFLGGSGPLCELFVPPDWPFFWIGSSGWFGSVLKQFSRRVTQSLAKSSSGGARRCEIIHWFNHLHFFDPQHSFLRKLRTSTYLGLEPYLPASKCCWCREFVKMKTGPDVEQHNVWNKGLGYLPSLQRWATISKQRLQTWSSGGWRCRATSPSTFHVDQCVSSPCSSESSS